MLMLCHLVPPRGMNNLLVDRVEGAEFRVKNLIVAASGGGWKWISGDGCSDDDQNAVL